MAGKFYRRQPSDWRQLIAPLAKFYGWAPRETEGLTITELVWWNTEAKKLIPKPRE